MPFHCIDREWDVGLYCDRRRASHHWCGNGAIRWWNSPRTFALPATEGNANGVRLPPLPRNAPSATRADGNTREAAMWRWLRRFVVLAVVAAVAWALWNWFAGEEPSADYGQGRPDRAAA